MITPNLAGWIEGLPCSTSVVGKQPRRMSKPVC